MIRFFLPALYFAASVVYCVIALSVLSKSICKKEYTIYSLMCMCLCIWSLSFSLGCYSVGYDVAVKWRKIASLGWSMFYPLTFLFVINTKKSNLSKDNFVTSLIILSGVACFVLHAMLGDFSTSQFVLEYSKVGWVNKSGATIGNIYFSILFILYLSLSLISVFTWMKSIENSNLQRYKQIKYIFISMGFASVMYASTELRINKIPGRSFPQITVLYALIPCMVIYYMIRRKRFIGEEPTGIVLNIISQNTRKKIFEKVGYIYVFYGFTLLGVSHFTNSADVDQHFWLFVIFLCLGSLHFVIPFVANNPTIDYSLFTLSSIFSMMLLSFRYSDYSGVTIWTMIFVFVIATAMFEKKIYSLIITSFIIAVNVIYWLYQSELLINISSSVYIIRILTIILTYLITNYTNDVFKQRFNESEEHISSQKVLTNISSDLININSDNEHIIINTMIKNIVDYFEFKSGILYKYKDKDSLLITENKYYLNKEDESANRIFMNKLSTKRLKWLLDRLLKKESTVILNTDSLPSYVADNKYFFKNSHIVGFIAYPIFVDDTFYGVMIFDFLHPKDKFTHDHFFSMAATLLGNAKKKLQNERELYYNVNYDKVTGLGNRRNFTSNIDNVLGNLDPKDQLALFHIDIYKFSTINEAFGYDIGDEVLKEVANILLNNNLPNSKCFRFGADEFMIYTINYGTVENLKKSLDKLWDIFRSPIKLKSYEFRISINMGIALFPQDGTTSSELTKNASLALNESIRNNNHIYSFCDDSFKTLSAENIQYTNRLYTALPNKEFALALQPQMDSNTGKIIGAEILLRWKDSVTEKLVSPQKFVPLLEETGLIIEVGEWIISEAIAIQNRLSKKGYNNLSFAINLSAIQFLDENLVSMIEKSIYSGNINPNNIELEITESSAIQEQHIMIEKFNQLKKLGCNIAIDDFGMEFSSLNRIQALPIDKIKIDKTFIDGIGVDPKKEAIIEIIINLAKILKVKCIAEGVEHDYQVKFLKEKGCTLIQGYYYSKPLFEKEFENFLYNNLYVNY